MINGEIKRKRLVFSVQLCYRTKAKEGTTPSTWIISSTVEIIHFEGTGLNDLCLNKSFILTEGKLLDGEKGLAYWCMPAILHFFLFIIILSFFSIFVIFDSFSLLFFLSQCLPMKRCCDSFLVVTIAVLPPTAHGKGPLYTVCCD